MIKTFTLHIEKLPEGFYLGTSPDIQGLVIEHDSVEQVIADARAIAPDLLEFHARMAAKKAARRPAIQKPSVKTPIDIPMQVAIR